MKIIRNLDIGIVERHNCMFSMCVDNFLYYMDAIEVCCDGIGFTIKEEYVHNYCYDYLLEVLERSVHGGIVYC